MNEEAQEILNKILAKNPDELNEVEKDFLRARRDYLKQSQLDEYAKVLNIKEDQTSEKETVKTKNVKNI